MFEGLIEDLTLATMADYDRLVSRLRLEGEAKAARTEERERNRQPRGRLVPWFHGSRRPSAAN